MFQRPTEQSYSAVHDASHVLGSAKRDPAADGTKKGNTICGVPDYCFTLVMVIVGLALFTGVHPYLFSDGRDPFRVALDSLEGEQKTELEWMEKFHKKTMRQLEEAHDQDKEKNEAAFKQDMEAMRKQYSAFYDEVEKAETDFEKWQKAHQDALKYDKDMDGHVQKLYDTKGQEIDALTAKKNQCAARYEQLTGQRMVFPKKTPAQGQGRGQAAIGNRAAAGNAGGAYNAAAGAYQAANAAGNGGGYVRQ